MSTVVRSLRALAGDALAAIGHAVRGEAEVWPADPAYDAAPKPIPRREVRSALDELPDSTLINIVATIIAGWKPALLTAAQDVTDVDLLVNTLRDRAAQWAAVEADAGEPLLTPTHLMRAVWTPEDARQTARDAALHLGEVQR